MSFLKEFKAFAMRGNVIDLAVAVVIGAAFGKITFALVDGMIMPFMGLLVGGIDISAKTWVFGQAIFKWGMVLQSIIDFTIIAFVIFCLLQLINKFYKQEAKDKPAPQDEISVLKEIRDLLKKE